MLIIADENIPFAREAFGTLGDVRLMSGRAMTAEAVRDADLLMVRSVTRVNADLLSGSNVRFVGTATIGMDHVDRGWLAEAGIRFTSAPGSNADSVAEYVTAALLVMARRQGQPLAGRTMGIVGVGNVGGRVAKKARALGMEPVLNDPPLQRKTGDSVYRPIEEVFDCDVVTLHVPLEKAGTDPTWHLADATFLSRLKPGATLINSSRGAVADNAALLEAIQSGKLSGVTLDVWEGEPAIRAGLLQAVDLGTPHIAGYSYDGKVNGTVMLYEAACEFLGETPAWRAADVMPPAEHAELALDLDRVTGEDALREAVLTVYPIERDDADLRDTLSAPEPERPALFDKLRKQYPRRREFPNTRLTLTGHHPATADQLRALGFK